jgi:hypothetical protein
MTYQSVVLGDSPTLFWQLAEASGTVAADSTSNSHPGTYEGTISAYGVAGCPTGNNAVTLDGSTGYIALTTSVASSTIFSLEAWFKVANAYGSGGSIVGFADSQTSTSGGAYDRMVYMTNTGALEFGIYATGGIGTGASVYNDGNWHYVVVTFSSGVTNQSIIYVDTVAKVTSTMTSAASYTGYWRAGSSPLATYPSAPSSIFLAGTIADVAVYPAVLTPTQIAAHYAATQYTPVYTQKFATQQAVKRASLW